MLEDDAGITVLADIPGVSKETLEIKVENDALSIEGAITAAIPQALEATYAEVRTPRYRRSFTLSRELDSGRIEAQLKARRAEAAHSEARAGAAAAHLRKG